jgi:hypothetical protein
MKPYSERRLRRYSRIHLYDGTIEGLIETITFYAQQKLVIERFFTNKTMTPRDYFVLVTYYAIKEIGYPMMARPIIVWLSDFTLGRIIITFLIRSEKRVATRVIVSILTYMTIHRILGDGPLDYIKMLTAIAIEFGIDEGLRP